MSAARAAGEMTGSSARTTCASRRQAPKKTNSNGDFPPLLFFVYSGKRITISLYNMTIVIYRYRDIISSIKDQPRHEAREGTKGEQNMKKYFNVSFQYSESVYCANIAHAESAEDVLRTTPQNMRGARSPRQPPPTWRKPSAGESRLLRSSPRRKCPF